VHSAVTFAPFWFAACLIHAAVGFSGNVKGCYVTPPEQVLAFTRMRTVSFTCEPQNPLLH
jgi:hypothetical protein